MERNVPLMNERKTSKTAFPVGLELLVVPIKLAASPEVPNVTKLLPRTCL